MFDLKIFSYKKFKQVKIFPWHVYVYVVRDSTSTGAIDRGRVVVATSILNYFKPSSPYTISHIHALKTANRFSIAFVANDHPTFFHSYCVAITRVFRFSVTLQLLSHSCPPYLFVYVVAVNSTISFEHLLAHVSWPVVNSSSDMI